jgi:hypothetical protein
MKWSSRSLPLRSGESDSVTVDYSPLYYWIMESQLTSVQTLGSGTFEFPTPGGNVAAYLWSDGYVCEPFHLELNSSYLDKASVVYINSVGFSKEAYSQGVFQGLLSPTVPKNYLTISYPSEVAVDDNHIIFCSFENRTMCDSTASISYTIPLGGTAVFINYIRSNDLTTYAVTGFSSIGNLTGLGPTIDDDPFQGDDDYQGGAFSLADIIGVVIGAFVVGLFAMTVYYVRYRGLSDPKHHKLMDKEDEDSEPF